MTLSEESAETSPPGGVSQNETDDNRHVWDINDSILPMAVTWQPYDDWPNGHCKRVYSEMDSDEARRHASGWAMRNTNNHNVNILKKSCLGVLVCSRRCRRQSTGGVTVHTRPAICDKARRKQLGKQCPNTACDGHLEMQPCRGHCGYPVTHFWRHVRGLVYFQAKGVHDHDAPELRMCGADVRRQSPRKLRTMANGGIPRKRSSSNEEETLPRKLPHLNNLGILNPMGNDFVCPCPPFECVCGVNQRPYLTNTYSSTDCSRVDTEWPNSNDDYQLEHLRKACFDYSESIHFRSDAKLKIDADVSTCMFDGGLMLPVSSDPCGLPDMSRTSGVVTEGVLYETSELTARCILDDFAGRELPADDRAEMLPSLPSITSFLDDAQPPSGDPANESSTSSGNSSTSGSPTSVTSLTELKPVWSQDTDHYDLNYSHLRTQSSLQDSIGYYNEPQTSRQSQPLITNKINITLTYT